MLPSCGLLPNSGEEVCGPQLPGELFWRERKPLVGPPMPDGSKGRGHMMCSPRFPRLWIGHGANNPTLEKSTVMKTPEPVEDTKTHMWL
jgi:hypothetical protein